MSAVHNDAQGSKYVTKWVSWTAAELAAGKWVMKYVIFKVPEGYAETSISPYLYGHYGAGIIEYDDDYRIEEFDEEQAGPPAEEEPYRFTGKMLGRSTGLYYFGAR